MSRETRPLRQLLVIVLGTAAVAWGLAGLLGKNGAGSSGSAEDAPTRIVSLSPGITEVMEQLGRSSGLVGISDYCAPLKDGSPLPRMGTALTPNYEAILRANPDLILTQEARDTPLDELRQLAPTVSLPWQTSLDLVHGIDEIGRLIGAETEAEELAGRVESTLVDPRPRVDAPAVLFVLEHAPGQLTEAWYVKDDTIHGDALRAAGARNAIPPGDTGVPRLSLERVIAIDPEAILLLSTRDSVPDGEAEQLLDDWRRLSTLRAAREDKLALVTGDRLYVTGPRVLDLVAAIRRSLTSLGLARTEGSYESGGATMIPEGAGR